jgi:hypothetical protein
MLLRHGSEGEGGGILFFSFLFILVLGREKAPVETEHGAISARKGIPHSLEEF